MVNPKQLSNTQLIKEVKRVTYMFVYQTDFKCKKDTNRIINEIAEVWRTSIKRIYFNKNNHPADPKKIFEAVESIFGIDTQPTYDINRTLSAVRRLRTMDFQADNKKYIGWLSNRIEGSSKELISHLSEM